MFNVVNIVTDTVIFSSSVRENAEAMLAVVDTTPSTHEIVEVTVEPAE